MDIPDELKVAFEALCVAQKRYLSVDSNKAPESEIVETLISREKALAELWKQLEKL